MINNDTREFGPTELTETIQLALGIAIDRLYKSTNSKSLVDLEKMKKIVQNINKNKLDVRFVSRDD